MCPNAVKVPCIPTGLRGIDRIIGGKGFPFGRIIELYGKESTSKSSLAIAVGGMAQSIGLKVASKPK